MSNYLKEKIKEAEKRIKELHLLIEHWKNKNEEKGTIT
tara:strand:- start:109 stop:222 length:114 start_codon:yes stop_codon:yes gene_type:complete